MPALFLGHGSPMNVLEDNVYTRAWRHLGETLPRPKAIVVVSAHWFTRGTGVTAMEAPKPFMILAASRRRCTRIIRPPARLSWHKGWWNCWRLFRLRWIKKPGALTMAHGAC
jgi:hypothetical protein